MNELISHTMPALSGEDELVNSSASAALMSVVMPCYNSAAYMRTGIDELLRTVEVYCQLTQDERPPLEIIIVDDGSTDGKTLSIAREYERMHPHVVRVIHQENGGHGVAVMAGVARAQGIYVKILDSDDQLDCCALLDVLQCISGLLARDALVDLIVTNYVYCHDEHGERVMRYHHALPQKQSFTWNDAKSFKPYQLMLMHALLYKTSTLQASGLHMLPHTFYVDNLYAYVPLTQVKTLRYLDVNLYRYRIGRSDQSVNESIMISRVDHQLRVNRSLVEQVHLSTQVSSAQLRSYMVNYLVMIFAISTIFAQLSRSSEAKEELERIWQRLHELDEPIYSACRRTIIGRTITRSGSFTLASYRLFKRIFKFN